MFAELYLLSLGLTAGSADLRRAPCYHVAPDSPFRLSPQPCIFIPWAFQPKSDLEKPWFMRWWVKANVWIFVYSFIGNYFWTHYFYQASDLWSSSGKWVV